MEITRRYDIDWLRVIAIGLLLIYHIAIIFQPWALFVGFIQSKDSIEGLWKPMLMLNVWRIPLLFYVSGMGVYFAMRKRNWKGLIMERARRIMIPFLFGILFITPIHMVIFQNHYQLPAGYVPHLGHLWFLGNIFIYIIVLSPLFFWLQNNEKGKIHQVLVKIMSNPLGPLLTVFFFLLEVKLVKPTLFAVYAETWHGFVLGSISFFCGFLFVHSGDSFWKTVKSWSPAYLTLATVSFVIRLTFYNMKAPAYVEAIECNLWILGWFGLGYRYLNHRGKILDYLSQAAYPIYIIHMFALYLGAWLILPLEVGVTLKFLMVVIFTFLICFFIYELIIRRVNFIRSLFGLKWKTSIRHTSGQKVVMPAEK